MLRKPASNGRGFSVPELLTVAGIASLIGAVIVALTGPMLSASNAEIASLHQIQMMDTTLYRLQREVRQSDPNGIFVCDQSSGQMLCNQASNLSAPVDIAYLAILTARVNGSGQTVWDSSGRPAWSGFNIYWLVPDGQGSNQLRVAFAPTSVGAGANPSILNSSVANAVSQATAGAGVTIAQDVRRLQTMVDVSRDHVVLKLVGVSTQGNATSELSVQGDVYARN